MKSSRLIVALFFVLVMVSASFAGDKAGKTCADMKGNTTMCCAKGNCPCPMCVKGAVVKVTNTADGVTISITSTDKAAVKAIQDSAAKCASMCANMPKAK